MFTPTEIEALPSAMEQLYRSLQLNIMSDLTKRLKANGEEITSAADWQINRLYELGVSKDEIDSLIQSTLDVSDDEIDRIYDEVVKSGYARNEELYTSKGKEYIPYAENKQLQQLVKAVKNQTKSEYRNITGSLGFAVRNADNTLSFTPLADFYQRTLDNGLMQITSGAVDYNTVLKKAVKAMTDSGLRTVDYASGWSNRVDVAVRRALMTGFNQVVAKVNEDNAEQLGTEYFEGSYHRGARPTHQVWQGRVYSKKELETVCGLGTVTGLCGANCYHSYSPFIKGVDKPTYSDEELDRMNEEENTPKEYNGRQYTAYEAQQKQRQLETAMRADRQKIELLTQGGADYDTITGAKAKYFQRQDEYVKFSKAMNLPQQWERITVNGKNALGSKLPKKAESVNRITAESVAKSGKSGIIKEKSKKPITPITDKAISRIPKVDIEGYTEEQCLEIQKQHKELLKFSKEQNDNKEVAFVLKNDVSKMITEPIKGTDEKIDFGSALQGKDLFVMHNHPRNSSYSLNDIIEFIKNDSIKTFTIVKNNGNIEVLTKLKGYDRLSLLTELQRMGKKRIKTGSDSEYRKVIDKFLSKHQEGGLFEWKK